MNYITTGFPRKQSQHFCGCPVCLVAGNRHAPLFHFRAYLDFNCLLVQVLSAFLLDNLESDALPGDVDHNRVLYFFCDDKDDRQKSAQGILRGLIHQLIASSPHLIEHAMRQYRIHGTHILESVNILWQIFITAAKDPSQAPGTCIILDALDECEQSSRDDLLSRLGEYFQSVDNDESVYIKVLMTSRPYPEIQSRLQNYTTIRLRTEDEEGHINVDIRSFTKTKVNELAKSRGYNDELKGKVAAALEKGVDGMFLWV